MKQIILILALFLGNTFSSLAADLESLQGKWTMKKSEDNTTRSLEFKKDKWTFRIMSEGSTSFVAEGEVEVKKLGVFNAIRLYNMKYGASETDLSDANDERNIVFILDGRELYLASNFDRLRDNENPKVEVYSKSAEAGKSSSAIVGTWKLEMKLADNALDYTLRITETAGKLNAVLISPRSGEHKVKSITFENNTLKMQIDREVDGTPATFVYTGKLEGETLAGDVSIKGGDQNTTATWTAKK